MSNSAVPEYVFVLEIQLTLPQGGGLLKPALNKNDIFGSFYCDPNDQKNLIFPNIYDNASHTLLGS